MIGFGMDGGIAPASVTPTTAIGISAVWRSLDILCSVATLPWREVRGNLELPPSRLCVRPQASRTRREWVSRVVSTLALFDVCYILKAGGYDSEGVPIGLWPLEPGLVTPKSIDYYTLADPDEYIIGDRVVPADALVILRRSPQPTVTETFAGVLNLARATFAAAISAERYASRYWQAGGAPQGTLETDQAMSDPDAVALSDRFAQRRTRGPDYWPVLSGGLKANPFGADPTTASAVEARRELVADVGRYFGIGTRQLNAPAGDSETYSAVGDEGMGLVIYTLANYIGAIEDGVSDQLPGGRRIQVITTRLTQGNQLTRAQTWALAVGGATPWMDVAEVREAEGLPPREIVPPAPAPAPAPVTAGGPNA